jgi:hypothetical protein
MSDDPHQVKADQREREADELEKRSEELDEDIAEAREDWEAKKRDDNQPGTPAVPKEPDADEDSTEERQGPEASSAKA